MAGSGINTISIVWYVMDADPSTTRMRRSVLRGHRSSWSVAASEAMETRATVLAMVLVSTPVCACVPWKWNVVGDGVVGKAPKVMALGTFMAVFWDMGGSRSECGTFHGQYV